MAAYFHLDIKKRFLRKIYKYLGEATTIDGPKEQELEPVFFKKLLKILKIFYNNLTNIQAYPNSFFVFPNRVSTIQMRYSSKQTKFDFSSGYSVQLWFYLEKGLNTATGHAQGMLFCSIFNLRNQDNEGKKFHNFSFFWLKFCFRL